MRKFDLARFRSFTSSTAALRRRSPFPYEGKEQNGKEQKGKEQKGKEREFVPFPPRGRLFRASLSFPRQGKCGAASLKRNRTLLRAGLLRRSLFDQIFFIFRKGIAFERERRYNKLSYIA